MFFKKYTCTHYINLSSQETINSSDDNLINDTGNNLETQVCPNIGHLPRRYALSNPAMQNNRVNLSQETNLTEHSAVTTETFLEDNALSDN